MVGTKNNINKVVDKYSRWVFNLMKMIFVRLQEQSKSAQIQKMLKSKTNEKGRGLTILSLTILVMKVMRPQN